MSEEQQNFQEELKRYYPEILTNIDSYISKCQEDLEQMCGDDPEKLAKNLEELERLRANILSYAYHCYVVEYGKNPLKHCLLVDAVGLSFIGISALMINSAMSFDSKIIEYIISGYGSLIGLTGLGAFFCGEISYSRIHKPCLKNIQNSKNSAMTINNQLFGTNKDQELARILTPLR